MEDFGDENCLVGISAEYNQDQISRMKFHYTEGYDEMECYDKLSSESSVGPGAFVLIFLVAMCVCLTCGTYCCGWQLPDCIVESWLFKAGFCFFCDWGQHGPKEDRSKKYEEQPPQQ